MRPLRLLRLIVVAGAALGCERQPRKIAPVVAPHDEGRRPAVVIDAAVDAARPDAAVADAGRDAGKPKKPPRRPDILLIL